MALTRKAKTATGDEVRKALRQSSHEPFKAAVKKLYEAGPGGEIMISLREFPESLPGEQVTIPIEEAILEGQIENTHEAAMAYLHEIKDQTLSSES